jgi:hypothetical protein
MSIKDKLLSGPLGFGAAPLGNMFRNVPGRQPSHERRPCGGARADQGEDPGRAVLPRHVLPTR